MSAAAPHASSPVDARNPKLADPPDAKWKTAPIQRFS